MFKVMQFVEALVTFEIRKKYVQFNQTSSKVAK